MARVKQTVDAIISTVEDKKIKCTLTQKCEGNKIYYIFEKEEKDKGIIEKRENFLIM